MLEFLRLQQENWYSPKITLPKRSHLYPLQPLGLGTSGVESFTSYITRLAAVHQIPTGVLLAQELAPFITRYKGHKPESLESVFFHIFFNQTGAWNGTGTMAVELLETLQKLTQQPTLRFLTFLTWASVLSTRMLLRKYHAWCPLCYSEWDKAGVPLHEPLIWSISAITACLKHQQPLLHQCSNCSQNIYPLAWHKRIGFCCRCQYWLGSSCLLGDAQVMTPQDWEWQNFVIQELGQLLVHTPYLIEPPQKEQLASNIDVCIQAATLGNAKAFANSLYLSPTVPRDWRTGNALPQLNLLLRVCYRLSISLVDIYSRPLIITHPILFKELPSCQQFFKTNRSFDSAKVKDFLEIHKNSVPPLSLRKLASMIGYDPADLYRHFPDLCRQISARYKLHTKFPLPTRI